MTLRLIWAVCLALFGTWLYGVMREGVPEAAPSAAAALTAIIVLLIGAIGEGLGRLALRLTTLLRRSHSGQ